MLKEYTEYMYLLARSAVSLARSVSQSVPGQKTLLANSAWRNCKSNQKSENRAEKKPPTKFSVPSAIYPSLYLTLWLSLSGRLWSCRNLAMNLKHV